MRFWTAICLILVLSALGLTYEISAGRVLAPFFGTSLLTWTAVIATILAGFSLGNAIGGFVAERDDRSAVRTVRIALLAAGVLMALTPTLLGIVYAWGARGTGGMIASAVAAFFPASVLVSVPSPLLARFAIQSRPGREGSSLGIVLAAGSIGAIAGAILAGFVALPLVGAAATFAACGAVALVCLLLVGPAGRGGDGAGDRAESPRTRVIVAAAAFTAFAGMAGEELCEYESGLSCLHVAPIGAEIRLFSDGIAQAAERVGATGDAAAPTWLALDYTRWIWARMDRDLGPAPSVLFIGGGGYTLPTQLLSARPDARAAAVEIDPLVTRVVAAHLPRAGETIDRDGGDGGRLEIVHADGRVYLNETARRFDAAVMDAFSSNSVPAHLATRQTYARLREIVSGPVYVNLIDAPGGALVRGVHAILDGLYPHIQAVRGPLTAGGRANFVLAAAPFPLGPADGLPEGYAPAKISKGRAFTDDRGWAGHR